MISSARQSFNEYFSTEKYRNFLNSLNEGFQEIPFRVAETPVFIPEDLQQQLVEAGNELIRFIRQPDFKAITEASIPENWKVAGENEQPHFLSFDFGIASDADGKLKPMLIELQGFPSLYGFQPHMAKHYKTAFHLPEQFSPYFPPVDEQSYQAMLREIIIGPYDPSEVAMLDVDPLNQKTAIDFELSAEMLGLKILGIEEIIQKDNCLFYIEKGEAIQLKRVYNRLIFDEIEQQQPELLNAALGLCGPLDIEWITHPNWFYRISKYIMPLLSSSFVPETHFLNQLSPIPQDLENYVLKPLFSFAGQGVIIDVTKADIEKIDAPQNWILQRKVDYAPVIASPEGGVKAEIRLMYLWPDGQEPVLCTNVTRLSRGKMIGVDHNKNFNWVGGTVGLMKS